MKRKNATAVCFAITYLLVCLLVDGLHLDGEWRGFFSFLLALPFSMVSMMVSGYAGGWPVFIIMNMIWWYGLVRFLFFLKNKSRQARDRLYKNSELNSHP